jgi:hypothetical protein
MEEELLSTKKKIMKVLENDNIRNFCCHILLTDNEFNKYVSSYDYNTSCNKIIEKMSRKIRYSEDDRLYDYVLWFYDNYITKLNKNK